MRYDWDRHYYVLSTGNEFYAHGAILGLAPSDTDDGLVIHHGYDGYVTPDSLEPFTQSERREIAAHMILLWQQWAETSLRIGPSDSKDEDA